VFKNLGNRLSGSNLTSGISSLFELIIQSLTFTFVLSGVFGYTLSLFIENFNIESWILLLAGILILTTYFLIKIKKSP